MDIDSGSVTKLNLLYPDFATRIRRVYIDMAEYHGVEMRMTEGLRTISRQKILYDQGRTTPGAIVTWAPPGFTLHHYGVASDSCQKGKKPWDLPWDKFAECAKNHGLNAGYFWSSKKQDKPHLELAYGGLSLEQMVNLYKAGGLAGVWAQFDKIRGVPVESEWKATNLLNMGII